MDGNTGASRVTAAHHPCQGATSGGFRRTGGVLAVEGCAEPARAWARPLCNSSSSSGNLLSGRARRVLEPSPAGRAPATARAHARQPVFGQRSRSKGVAQRQVTTKFRPVEAPALVPGRTNSRGPGRPLPRAPNAKGPPLSGRPLRVLRRQSTYQRHSAGRNFTFSVVPAAVLHVHVIGAVGTVPATSAAPFDDGFRTTVLPASTFAP